MSHSMHLRSNGHISPVVDENSGPEMPGDFLPTSSPEIPSSPVGHQSIQDDVPPLGDDYAASRGGHARRNSVDSLSSSQAATIQLATANLSEDSRDVINCHNTSVFITNQSDSETSEAEAEPVKKEVSKGKGVDSRNWGNIQLPDDEVDADLQAALQASLRVQHNLNKGGEASRMQHNPDTSDNITLKQELEDLCAKFEVLKLEKSSKRREQHTANRQDEKMSVKLVSMAKTHFGSAPVNRLPVPTGDKDLSSSSLDVGSEGDILSSTHITKNSALGVAFKGLNGRQGGSPSSSSPSSSDDDLSSSSDKATVPVMIKRRKRQ
ncbi:hypothetical protein BDN71DRAFT_1508918 [Pleurotus eryngii]|uniref:Uncharacterized protein n=1 Tax=Pleurotus eryngii TaxID=5323 RepID=A0A9P6D557_PLEER|nr:hypothetical protein BDN71DRAFT_1508918 [Pleurotus eryngii]